MNSFCFLQGRNIDMAEKEDEIALTESLALGPLDSSRDAYFGSSRALLFGRV